VSESCIRPKFKAHVTDFGKKSLEYVGDLMHESGSGVLQLSFWQQDVTMSLSLPSKQVSEQ